ncbi:MAG TPA: sigma factor-like helix-turn-helix DNA-binding protein [bacterium]|nr:sigma factor-like helix-turn-helix DNA-binding protein [bacterium]
MPLQKTRYAPPTGRAPRSLAGRTAVIRLFDAYAGLLTARQQQLLRLYYHEDLSLGEIGARLRVSRQAVFDGLQRAVGEMRYLEDRLGVLAARRRNGRARPDGAAARLGAVEREAARLTRAGAATGPLLRALRALRNAMPVS